MPVTVIEKFYVQQNMDVLTVNDIATALGWTPQKTGKYIKFLQDKAAAQAPPVKEKVVQPPEEVKPQVSPIVPGKAFARNKERGVVAMTGAESMVGDEFHQSKFADDPMAAMKDCIHRPKKD